MAVPFLMRGFPLRIRLPHPRLAVGQLFGQLRRPSCTASTEDCACPSPAKEAPNVLSRSFLSPDNPADQRSSIDIEKKILRSKINEKKILQEIEPIVLFTKHILHSDRYGNGDRLNAEDEKAVLEKLLPYHRGAVEKIGCGVDYIKVDIHPEHRCVPSRCLFIVRTDGGCIDFSYKICLYGYICTKYPSHAKGLLCKLPTLVKCWGSRT